MPAFATPEVKNALKGKIVLDPTNAWSPREGAAAEAVRAGGAGSGEWVARQLGDARVSAYARTPYEFIPYDVSYGVSHTGSLGAFTNFKRASKSFTNLHKI